ncbi:hypothetical protein ACLB2K_029429 [Fragaria x ananassa]
MSRRDRYPHSLRLPSNPSTSSISLHLPTLVVLSQSRDYLGVLAVIDANRIDLQVQIDGIKGSMGEDLASIRDNLRLLSDSLKSMHEQFMENIDFLMKENRLRENEGKDLREEHRQMLREHREEHREMMNALYEQNRRLNETAQEQNRLMNEATKEQNRLMLRELLEENRQMMKTLLLEIQNTDRRA